MDNYNIIPRPVTPSTAATGTKGGAGTPSPALTGTARDRALAIVERCGGGRERHGTWHVPCPAHKDANPSLNVTISGDRVLLHCFAGCDVGAICTAICIHLRDLFDDAREMPPRPQRPTHLGPRIPEPPGGLTPQTIALQVALELILDDCKLLEVDAVKTLFRTAAADPLTRLWITQQLHRHHLDPATVWQIVKAPTVTVTAGLRTFSVTPSQGAAACPAR